MIKKIIKHFLLIILFIIFFNINMNTSNAAFPITDTYDIPMNLTIYNSTSNIWCIHDGMKLGQYHECLYKVTGSGTLNPDNEAQAALAKALYDNRTVTSKYNIGAHQTGEIEGAIQQLAKKAGIGEKASSNGSNKANEYTDFGKLISILKNIDGKTIETNASKGDKSYYLSEAIDKFQGYYNQDIKCEVTSVTGTKEAWIVESTGAQQIQIINKDKQAFYVRFNDATEDTVKLKVKVTVDKMPKTTKYKIIRPQECNGMCSKNHTATYSKIWKNYIDTSNFKVVGTRGEDGWVSENKNAFFYKGSLYAVSTLEDNRVHNCSEHKLLKNFLTEYSLNEQPLMIVDFEEGSLEFEFEIIIKLDEEKITVKKEWEAEGTGTIAEKDLPDVTINLLDENKNVINSCKLNASNNFEHVFTKDKSGKKLEKGKKYFLQEEKGIETKTINGVEYTFKYKTTKETEAKVGSTYTFKNSYDGDTPGKLIIIKNWSGSGLPDSMLPSITVKVTGPNGYNKSFTLNSSNSWKVEIDNLEDGEYKVTENTGNSEITYNGKKYTITYDSSTHTAKVGNTVTIRNSYEGDDEPEPGDDEPDFNIEKKLVAVVSKLEKPDTSLHDVQRGDKAIFEITVTNTTQNPEDEEIDVEKNDDEDSKREIGSSNYTSSKVNCTKYELKRIPGTNIWQPVQCGGWALSDKLTGKAYETKTKEIERTYYVKHIEYSIKKIQLKDEVDGSYLGDAIYYENADFTEYCIDGLNFKSDEGWNSALSWQASDKSSYLQTGQSTKLYVVCDIDDVEAYGETDTNTAKVEVGALTWNKYESHTYYNEYHIKTVIDDQYTLQSSSATCNVNYEHSIYVNKAIFKQGSTTIGETQTEKAKNPDPNPEESDTDITNKEAKEASDTVTMVGYDVSIVKELTKVESELEKDIPVSEYVQLGDKLTYTITIKNDGNTNTYQEFKITDILVDGIEVHEDNSLDWVEGGDGYENTNIKGPSQSEVDSSVSRIASSETADVEFIAKVIGDPGTNVINKAVYNYFHNRNKIEIEANKEDDDQRIIDDYAVSVDKYITKAESRQPNSVGDAYQSSLGSRAGKKDDEKNGKNAYITDRGDTVTYKIVVKNEHDRTNIWKLTLEDEFNIDNLGKEPVLEYVECTSNDWKVEVNGSKLTCEYSASEWSKPLAPGESIEIELKLLVIEGAELEDKGDTYQNKATITDIWNRNKLNESIETPGKKLLDFDTDHQHESSDWCTVRQINAVIDKYVSKVYGGIEDVVYNNESRKRESDTLDIYQINEEYKKNNNVPVERGDEITYTLKIRNTGEGIITVMKLEDIFDKELIFNKFTGESGWTCDAVVTAYKDKKNKLNITYNGWLNPGDEATLKLIFIMTNEEDDKYDLYGRNYTNTLTTTEIQNINSWTWDNNGAKNGHDKDGTCKLEYLQNGEDGIPSNMSSSDYVYMLEYKVELDKYVINVKHTNDDGSEDTYDKNTWVANDETKVDTDRGLWNNFEEDYYNSKKQAKGSYKEQYPVQVEKNDIVTYEIKIKNTNDESIPGDTSIYALDIADIFSSEDGSDKTTNRITDNNIGLELMVDETKAENNNQLEILSTSSDKNQYLFKFTPKGQCSNSGKSTNGYGIGVNEVATFRIVVKVTRSNMYLYELRNTAVITSVYNRNNNIGNNEQDEQYTYSSTDTNRRVNDAYRVTNGNRAYILQNGSIVEQLTLNGLSKISKINEITLASEITVANKIADADYINLKDLIISGYVWDDTDPDNKEDGLMTSTDTEVEGEVWAYLYRVEPISEGKYPEESTLVMKTKIDKNGYYIFGTPNETTEEINTEVYSKENNNKVTVNQKYRFEPTTYKTPRIKVNGTETKDTQTKEIYENNFTNYRIVKAPNKDYNQAGSTTRYWINEYKGYYQYYVEFEYNGMKYTHTVYASDSVLDGAKGNAGNTSNQDGQYNLIRSDRATRTSENWLPYRTSTKDNSEYYEIDSNAAEFKSVRESFNNQFETVAVDKGIDPNGNETGVEYEKTGHTSQYKYNDNVKIRARSFITNWIDKVGPEIKNDDSKKTYRKDLYNKFSTTIGDYTNTLFFWDSKNTIRKGNDISNYANTVGTTEETEYLKYINLGLKQRPTLDLELTKDVYNVQVDINEKTMVYEYNCGIPTNRDMTRDDSYYTTGYKLYLYKSDYYYRYTDYSNAVVQDYKKGIEPENSELNPKVIDAGNERDWLTSLGFKLDEEKSESELNIQITYKYTITNKSGMPVDNRNELIIGSINEIVDYHNADLIPNQTGRFVKNVNIQDVEEKQYNNASENNEPKSGTVKVSTVYGNKNGNKNGYQTINGDRFDDNNKVKEYEYEDEDKEKIEKFHTVYLSGMDDVKLYPKDSLDIYLTFTVSRTATEYNDIGKAISLETKYNIAEISAFSSWYDSNFTTEWSKNLKTPGLVDKDSNPGNEEIGNIMDASQYEDDTYRVDITPELYGGPNGNKGERLIDGLVWEDVKYNYKGVYDSQVAKTINETMQVVSDGIYKGTRTKTVEGSSEELPVDKDQLIGNVKVELIEMIPIKDAEGNVIKVYEDRATVKKEIEKEGEKKSISQVATKTSDEVDNKGRYELYGYIPGNYVVRFTYGDECETIDSGYNGQDYKSTTYQVNKKESLDEKYSNVTYDANKTDGYITNIWHDLLSSKINGMEITGKKDYDNNTVQEDIDHVSDARDDEVRRLEVSAYSRTINNKVAEVLNSATNLSENESDKVKTLHKALGTNTWMFADTAKLQVEIEHLINVDEYKKQFIDMSKLDGENIQKLESYRIKEQATRINSEDIKDEDPSYTITNKEHSYYIGNIDFGLEARPTTNISLTKLVSGIRVETADGEEILDVEYEPQYSENGTLLLNDNGVPTVDNTVTTGAEHMQALNSSTTDTWNKAGMTNEEKTPDALKQIYRSLKTTQGFYYINIDEDLMQGAVITLRYSIVVANESEVDTLGMLTGYKTGEDIYNEVANIFEDKDTQYEYLNTKANNKLPTYVTDENTKEIKTTNVPGLKYGYFSGATYYTGAYHTDTYVVETRIDQIIDYVDNNLNVREEDNSTKDSSWRTVSLKELVEGDIQKDIVGQENDNNIYENNITLKYVPYEYAKQYTKEKQNNKEDEPKKVISVNNVGNMLADEVYRIKDLGTNNLGEIEAKIPNAKANGEIAVDSTGVIKDEDGKGNEMTIMDSIGREYITAQRNNILLSIPETDKNPDLYKYLIPAKALTAKPNVNAKGEAEAIEIKIDQITDEKINNENTSNEVKDAMKELIKKFKERENLVMFPDTLEGLKNYINAYMADENFNGDEKIYEIAEGKLLKLAQGTIATELSKYVYGTQNGESAIREDNKIKGYEKKNGDTSAKIKITATRTISPESTADERDDLTFENLAEILQFSNEAGRRDEFATVGDAQVWEGAWQASTGMTPQGGDPGRESFGDEESGQYKDNNQTENNKAKEVTRTKERYDTDTTEMVLLSPPTGLSQRELVELGTVKTQNNILLISVLTLTMTATIIIVIKISNRKKFYR